MNSHIRIARPVSSPGVSARMYMQGLSMEELGSFTDHGGFDGVMLGHPGGDFHFEFTRCRHHPVTPAPTPEDLVVFYVPDPEGWNMRCAAMRDAGFCEAESFNPYWDRIGRTFLDPDGYRVVVQCASWRNTSGS